MSKTGRTIIPAFAGVTVLLLSQLGLAEPTISAHVNANQIRLNTFLTLTIEVTGISNLNNAPNLNLPDFQVQRAGQTESFQLVNGQGSSMIAFNYVLTPTKAGNLQIPSITLQSEGKSYSTQPILITVAVDENNSASKSASVPSEGLKPVFMTASVDKPKAFVGQQILLTIQFLRRPNVQFASKPIYREPDMTGFVVEPLKQQEYTTNLNGIPYVISELPYALFPTSDGDYAIGNAAIDVAIRTQMDPFDPTGFFQNFINPRQAAQLTTHAVPIQVRALPKTKPNGFSGSVGRFKISSKVDSKTPEVGKPLNLIVKVEGTGNIKSIREPQFLGLKSFRRYETISSNLVNNEGKLIHGSKEFKILLIPQVSGTFSIPEIYFSYFNPEEQQYRTVTAPAIPLQVKPGNLTTASTDRPNALSPADQTEEGIRVVENDIRFIKQGEVYPSRGPLSSQAGFWILLSLPPFFAMGAALATYRTRQRLERAGFYRSKEAYKTAKRELKSAKKFLSNPDHSEFFGALTSALVGFLADKLSLSASGAIWTDFEVRLMDNNVPGQLIAHIREIWNETDMARFGISKFSLEEKQASLKKTDDVLMQLSKIL